VFSPFSTESFHLSRSSTEMAFPAQTNPYPRFETIVDAETQLRSNPLLILP
jgi:hypothetical protein